MNPRTIRIGVAQSAVLAVLAAAMVANTPPERTAAIERAIDTVRSIGETGAQWSLEAARVRADPGANFDGLAALVPRMRDLRETLTREIAMVPELHDDTARAARAYNASAEALRERIERFKSAYAVVRNSERFLPIAAAELMEEAHAREDELVVSETSIIAHTMTQFIGAAEEELGKKIEKRLDGFERTAKSRPARLAAAMERFSAHARVILEKRGRTDELLEEITAGSLGEKVAAMETELGAQSDQLETERDQMRKVALAAVAGIPGGWLLLALVAGIGGRGKDAAGEGTPSRAEHDEREEPTIDLESALRAEDDDEEADAVAALMARRAPQAPDADEAARAPEAPGGDEPGEPVDVIAQVMRSGTMLATMGHTLGAYAQRMNEDLEAVKSGTTQRESARMRRLASDTHRIAFFAQRMSMLGKQSASRERVAIDVTQAIERTLAANGAREQCSVASDYQAKGRVHGAPEDVALMCQIMIEYALQAISEGGNGDTRLEVATRDEGTKVAISVAHNAGGVGPERPSRQFIPFYAAQPGAKGVEMACLLHIARRYGGRAWIEANEDNGAKVEVRLEGEAD